VLYSECKYAVYLTFVYLLNSYVNGFPILCAPCQLKTIEQELWFVHLRLLLLFIDIVINHYWYYSNGNYKTKYDYGGVLWKSCVT